VVIVANCAALPTADAAQYTPLRTVNRRCSGFPVSGGINIRIFNLQIVANLQVFPTQSDATSKSSRNATVTSMIVCCGFIICWSSIEILFFLRYIGSSYNLTRNWFYHLNSVAPPLGLQAQFLIFLFERCYTAYFPFLYKCLLALITELNNDNVSEP